MTFTAQSPTIRATQPQDLPQTLNLYNRFVAKSTVTLDLEPRPIARVIEQYHFTLKQSLPYLVAIEHIPPEDDLESKPRDQVLDYAYAFPCNSCSAYATTVEIAVYIDPSVYPARRGTGQALLPALLSALESVPRSERRPHAVREILAIAAVGQRENDPRQCFLRAGFEQVGITTGVGCKFGQRVDEVVFQMSLASRKQKAMEVGSKVLVKSRRKSVAIRETVERYERISSGTRAE
ncbi:hypothetical protein MMC21_002218 [Puttea exsequens]|nr:hypothetical protein [Puttea exsequens]